MSLQQLIDTFKFRSSENKPHTHTYFGSYISKLSVPESERDTFYNAYIKYLQTTPIEVLQSTGYNCLTEKSQSTNFMFADIDLKMEAFESKKVDKDSVYELMNDVVTMFREVVNRPMVTAFRMIYKCHIYFPDTRVTAAEAKRLCRVVSGRLRDKYPWLIDYKLVDDSVYTSGLRMIGSHKGSMDKTGQERAKHFSFFGESLPYKYFYTLGQLDAENHTINERWPFSMEQLSEATIIAMAPGTVVESEIMDVDGGEMSGGSGGSGGSGSRVRPNGGSTEPVTDLAPEISTAISEYIPAALGPHNIKYGIVKTKRHEEYGSIDVTLECQSCPFAERIHTRTRERGTPALYVRITAFDVTLNCWKCTEQHLPLPPVGAVLETHFRGSCPDYTLKHSLYTQTNESIAEYIFSVVKLEYAATPSGGEGFRWYYYDWAIHRWVEYERILFAIMSEDGPVQQGYKAYLQKLTKTDATADAVKKTTEKLVALQRQLQTTAFVRSGLIPILARKLDYYWSRSSGGAGGVIHFDAKLDTNAKLMGFQNGVWDFQAEEFRAGKPSDFISLSCHNKYIPYDEHEESIRNGLEGFMAKMFVKKEHRDFLLQEVASCLNGTPNKNRFFLMTGGGANGKSTLIRMLNLAMGDYAGEVAITLFTHGRPAANQATPELVQIKGKRVVCCSEPNAKDSLNLGTIKWLTGGDRITARQLYQNNISFYMQATFFCLTNDIPPINASQQDFGTWRRIKPVCFNSKFTENPDPTKETEFMTDDGINDKLELWKDAFIAMLVRIHLEGTTMEMPFEFKQLLQQLQNKNDHYGRFIEEYITKLDPQGPIKDKKFVFNTFSKWLETLRVSKTISYDIFEKHMIDLLGPLITRGSDCGWAIEMKSLAVFGFDYKQTF